jgi:hypothetical protein
VRLTVSSTGFIDSGFAREAPGWVVLLFRTFVFRPPSYGALTPLWAGTSPEAEDLNGKVRSRMT